ncbi:MAG: FAD/NAD(P)-binding:oxidoreductase [Desulfobacteraceae bacterium]|nr:FAD/NAD(P)-binding:oxidoreductase [Desulfobacteraceae bacterium]
MIAYIKTKFFRQLLLIFIGIPLLIWVRQVLPVRSTFKESLSILTILTFCQMFGMFFWSRLNRSGVKDMKMVQVIKFHKIIGYTCTAVLLLHPVFLVIPKFFESGVSPVDAFVTILTTWNLGIVLGLFAWSLLLIIGITSLIRKKLPMKYTTWRSIHCILAVIFIFVVAWHVIDLGYHSNTAMIMFIKN